MQLYGKLILAFNQFNLIDDFYEDIRWKKGLYNPQSFKFLLKTKVVAKKAEIWEPDEKCLPNLRKAAVG